VVIFRFNRPRGHLVLFFPSCPPCPPDIWLRRPYSSEVIPRPFIRRIVPYMFIHDKEDLRCLKGEYIFLGIIRVPPSPSANANNAFSSLPFDQVNVFFLPSPSSVLFPNSTSHFTPNPKPHTSPSGSPSRATWGNHAQPRESRASGRAHARPAAEVRLTCTPQDR
jgi:hypothetical protein